MKKILNICRNTYNIWFILLSQTVLALEMFFRRNYMHNEERVDISVADMFVYNYGMSIYMMALVILIISLNYRNMRVLKEPNVALRYGSKGRIYAEKIKYILTLDITMLLYFCFTEFIWGKILGIPLLNWNTGKSVYCMILHRTTDVSLSKLMMMMCAKILLMGIAVSLLALLIEDLIGIVGVLIVYIAMFFYEFPKEKGIMRLYSIDYIDFDHFDYKMFVFIIILIPLVYVLSKKKAIE